LARVRPAASWIATAVLLIGLGSDLGASPGSNPRSTEDRVPASDDPVARLASAIPGPPHDEPVDDRQDTPGLPPGGAGPTRLGVLALAGFLAGRRGLVTSHESSSPRGPPRGWGPCIASRPTVPSRIDRIPIDLPYRVGSGRGPPTFRSRTARVPRSARLTTRAQETEP